MKKILPVLITGIFIWGCAKKMTPAKSETPPPVSNTGSVINNTAKPADPNTGTGSVGNTPAASSATDVTKTALPREKSPEENAAIAGQATFNAKCGKCHGLKVAGDYTAVRWANILAVMAPRANLTETERNNVYEYVKANSKK